MPRSLDPFFHCTLTRNRAKCRPETPLSWASASYWVRRLRNRALGDAPESFSVGLLSICVLSPPASLETTVPQEPHWLPLPLPDFRNAGLSAGFTADFTGRKRVWSSEEFAKQGYDLPGGTTERRIVDQKEGRTKVSSSTGRCVRFGVLSCQGARTHEAPASAPALRLVPHRLVGQSAKAGPLDIVKNPLTPFGKKPPEVAFALFP